MALIKKFKVEKFTSDETIVEIKNASVFYNKRQILNNLNLKIKTRNTWDAWSKWRWQINYF